MRRATVSAVFLGLLLIGVGFVGGRMAAGEPSARFQIMSLRATGFFPRGDAADLSKGQSRFEKERDERQHVFLLDTRTGRCWKFDMSIAPSGTWHTVLGGPRR